MIPVSLQSLLAQRRTLLLQGPMGPFFTRLAEVLRAHGQQVWKVNFNAGDEHFYPPGDGVLAFRDPLPGWSAWLEALLHRQSIDALVVFGQTRGMHEQALAVARRLGLGTFVFEEGYLRPDFVTLECGGVNADSSLPRSAAFYRQLNLEPQPAPVPTGQTFKGVADLAMTYAMAQWRGRARFPHYQHHRSLHPLAEGGRWVRGGWRKWRERLTERDMEDFLCRDPAQHKRFFLVPLQVHNDAQIIRHSRFTSVADFIVNVMRDFASHAPDHNLLVFKHHPLDRPYFDYRRLIEREARLLGLSQRVHYIHDQHLPTLLQHARGVVTVNSTTGLQSLYHRTPVAPLGDCFYAIPGLVHLAPLADFWLNPGQVDRGLYQSFTDYVLRETQLNASFYAAAPGLPSVSTVDSRRRALVSSTPRPVAQASSWSSPTAPTLK